MVKSMKNLIKLVSVGSDALEKSEDEFDFSNLFTKKEMIEEAEKFYSLKNGFYAFESALHVFPISERDDIMSFQKWNSKHLWRAGFPELEKDVYFFAEDVFGMQFCFKNNEIFLFDGETFKFDLLAKSIEEWAEIILKRHDYYTGYSLAHKWQEMNGSLKINKRLGPITPFFLGGKFSVENLNEIDSSELMRFRASLYKQSKNLPDGTKVKLIIKKS